MKQTLERLQAFLAAARVAVADAKISNPTARGMAGIGWKLPDGSGQLVCDFDSEPLCNDLEVVLNALAKDREALALAVKTLGMKRVSPSADQIASTLQRTYKRKVIEAHLRGAEAMRVLCREVADENREAIDALSPPEFPSEVLDEDVSDDEWRDRAPTIEEVAALAETVDCNVWSGETQWMILQPTDQTMMVSIVLISVDTYDANIKYAMDQGASFFRPLTTWGDYYPWPVIP